MDIKELLDREPDVSYTDADAVNDGTLVDLFDLGVKVYWNGRPVTRMTSTLFDALKPYSSGGTAAEQSAAYTALLAFIVNGSHDTAQNDEPKGQHYECGPSALTWHRGLPQTTDLFEDYPPPDRVGLVPNDTTEYADVPGSAGGWTVMFASDH